VGIIDYLGDHSGFLLDTHAFLWACKQPGRLGEQAYEIIEDIGSRLYLSAISAFEASNKHRLGKLDPTYDSIIESYSHFASQLGVEDLPLTIAHTYLAGEMDWQHRDPFDRLLVAQACLENLAIITDDERIKGHPWVDAIW
jgi:PIN domain nuclease of toxin-antitoxin system